MHRIPIRLRANSILFLWLILLIALIGGPGLGAAWADVEEGMDAAAEEVSEPSAGEEAETIADPEAAAPPAAPLEVEELPEETPEEAVERLSERIQEIEEEITAREDDEHAEPGALPVLLDRMRVLRNLYQRRIGQQERFREAEELSGVAARQRAEFEEEGLGAEPPYPITLLDGLRDEWEAARRELDTERLSLAKLEDGIRRAERSFSEAQTARRQARDAFEGGRGANEVRERSDQLRIAQLDERIAEQRLEIARTEVELSRRFSEVREKFVALFEEKVAKASSDITYPEELLEERLADLQARRERLEERLPEMRRVRDREESRLFDARQAYQRAESDEQRQARLEAVQAREAAVLSSNRGIEYAEQRLVNLSIEQMIIERRYALINGEEGVPIDEWRRETSAIREEIGRQRSMVDARLNDVRTAQLGLSALIESGEHAGTTLEEMRNRLRHMQTREQHGRDYLASLMHLERVAERLDNQLRDAASIYALDVQWERFLAEVQRIWNLELFVLEDRGFTVARLTQASLMFLLVLALASAARFVLRRTLVRRLTRHDDYGETFLRDTILTVIRQTKPLFVGLLGLYMGSRALPLSDSADTIARSVISIAILVQIAIYATSVLGRTIDRTRARRAQDDPSSVSAFGLMAFFGRIAIWSVVLLIALDNFGFEITAIVAGLGIGGIAIAFALQNILGDVFCSIAILLDKPFVVGDFIIVGDSLGVVEHIGIKTTRVRSLGGEQIIFSNADLLGSRIRNFKRMFERRIVFGFGVTYETPPEKLEKIPGMVREIIEGEEPVRFDRAHFKAFGDYSLDFEVVYFVLVADFTKYMDIQQNVNIAMYRAFQAEGINFAYPTKELIVRPMQQG